MVIVYNIGGRTIYVGVDQFENEDLIKFSQRFMEGTGLTLVWHHADKMSSPHAYVRLLEGETVAPEAAAMAACQTVKDGSIEGTKRAAIDIVFTPASNLAKRKGMNPGQVSFHNRALVGVTHAVRKDSQVLKDMERARMDMPLADLERELADLMSNVKQAKKKPAKGDDPFGDDDEDDDPFNEEPPRKETIFGAIPKAEFNANMEDDFM